MADGVVVVTLTDFVTVPPTPRPPSKTTLNTSILSSSREMVSQTLSATASLASSVSEISTPSVPPAPIAVVPKDTLSGNKMAAAALAALILVIILYLIGLCLGFLMWLRGRCMSCHENEAEIRKLKAGKGVMPITIEQVREREMYLAEKRWKEEQEKRALDALEGKREQVHPAEVVVPVGARTWGACVTLDPPRPGHHTPPSPVSSIAESNLARPDQVHLPSEHPVTPFVPSESQPPPDGNSGQIYRNNRFEVISHFEPYM